jgi:hypothetical protein
VKGDGAGQTIAIVNAYDNPNIQSDLNIFSAQFGLASTTITKVNQHGGTNLPATDPTGGWTLETALDVQWAHAMAPGANILLVEANSDSITDLLTAVSYASANASVVSMSWGGSEFAGQTVYNSYFDEPGVVFVASSGDVGAPVEWPAASSNVLAVGGTSLSLTANGDYASESGWSGSGGGPSSFEAQPSYQRGVVAQTTMRANPDVSYDANPTTGFAVYNSFNSNGKSQGWIEVGGTSAGAPQWAALIAIADQGRALSGQSALNSTDPQEVQSILYQNRSAFHDVISGNSTGSTHYSAAAGYDLVTGLGSPYADRVVAALSGAFAPSLADSLTISAPSAATAGDPFSVTVTANTSAGAVDTSYLGTIAFSGSDRLAGLPSSYTFTAADKGSHSFAVTLKTAGVQSLTATDATNAATPATTSGIVVRAAAASGLVAPHLYRSIIGTPQSLTFTAVDPYGNVATTYAGTVRLTSTDASASFTPSTYTFTTADKGVHTFKVNFGTAGPQAVTITDATSGFVASTLPATVSPAAPTGLTATAISTSQVNLSWTASPGATGYTIQRSANGSTGWTHVVTTAAGTTSYTDSGMAAGTTYYYRVKATGGVDSAFTLTSATTKNVTATTTTDTFWSNSFTPDANAYSIGSYEVGLKFSSTVSGTVTGVRFYKQPYMNGYVHVGHLWSSSGILLATAAFTGETESGWQQVSFTAPVAISADTTYIISFSTGGGRFGITTNSFQTAGQNGRLQIPANAGVLGPAGAFPRVSSAGMNFWADVAFSPNSTPQTVIKTSAQGTTSGMTVLTTGTPAAAPSSSTTTRATATPNTVIDNGSTSARTPVNQAPPTSGSFSKQT